MLIRMYGNCKDLEEKTAPMNETVKEYIRIYKDINNYQFATDIVSGELKHITENIKKLKQQHGKITDMYEKTSTKDDFEILKSSYEITRSRIKDLEDENVKLKEKKEHEFLQKKHFFEKVIEVEKEEFEFKRDQLLQKIDNYHGQLQQKKKNDHQEFVKQESILKEIKTKHQAVLDEKNKELQIQTEKYNAMCLEIMNLKSKKMLNDDMKMSDSHEEFRIKEAKLKELLQENKILDENIKTAENRLNGLKKESVEAKTVEKQTCLEKDEAETTSQDCSTSNLHNDTNNSSDKTENLSAVHGNQQELLYFKRTISHSRVNTSVPVYTAKASQFRPKMRKNGAFIPPVQIYNNNKGNKLKIYTPDSHDTL